MILVAFAYIAFALVVVWALLVALEAFAPDVARGWFGQVAEDNEAQEQARAELTAQTLEFAHDPEAQIEASRSYMQRWEDHPAYRADIAKTRRQQAGRREMRKAWERGTDGAA